MRTVKRLLAFALAGAILGAVASSFVAPGLIRWYNTPGEGMPPGLDFSRFVDQITRAMLQAQLLGAALGALVVLAIGVAVSRGKKTAPTPASPPGPQNPPVS